MVHLYRVARVVINSRAPHVRSTVRESASSEIGLYSTAQSVEACRVLHMFLAQDKK